jgi:hypothetical protein
MKTKLLTTAMTVVLMLTAMTKIQAQNLDDPCLPQMHGLDDHQSALCGLMQTIALSAGWNWFSTNVEITLSDLKAALMEALPGATNIVIKSQSNGQATYNGNTWRGQLTTLDVRQMYRIKVQNSGELTLAGTRINPAEHAVAIASGANWIGFPLSENKTLGNAFAGFAVSGDVVKSQSGLSTFNGTIWRGGFSSLEPGKGYIYKSNVQGTRTFTFPANAK